MEKYNNYNTMESPRFKMLRKEELMCVFKYLSHSALVRAGFVCKLWQECVHEEDLWEKLHHFYTENVWKNNEIPLHEGVSPNVTWKARFIAIQTILETRDKENNNTNNNNPKYESKTMKSPRKLLQRFSASVLSRSSSMTFGDSSREWNILGGFRKDHADSPEGEVRIKGSPRGLTTSLSMVDVKKIWKEPYLKYLVRQGIPDAHRPAVWANMVGVKDMMTSSPDMYQATLRVMFGTNPPKKFYKVPNFGGPNFDLLCDGHSLSPEGNICAKRILCVLAMENPDLHFCPTLPDLVQLFLRYMTEGESYMASRILLNRSVYMTNSTTKSSSSTQFFTGSFKGTLASCRVFDLLVQQYVPRLHAALKTQELSVGILLYHKWFNRLFVDVLPMKIVLRIFDSYLLDGMKGILRIGLAILRYCQEDLVKVTNSQEFSSVLSTFHYFGFDEAIFADAYSIPLRRAMLQNMYASSYQKLGNVKEPISHVYYHPKNLQLSEIIQEDEFEMLWAWLPPTLRIKDPHLEFSTNVHGRSLNFLMDKISKFEATLFIVLNNEERVFGIFVNSSWNCHKCQFFGDRESFVYTMRPVPDHFMWTPGHANDRMQYITVGAISLGAGPPAFVLHNDMTITSHACPTFQSPPLGLLSNFDSLILEVYSIY